MDLNLVVVSGRLAAAPEVRVFDSGVTVIRLLVTTKRTEPRQRTDVVPVTYWGDPDDMTNWEEVKGLERGDRVWVAGSVQRRFQHTDYGASRIEVVANHVQREVEINLEELAS
jgi:single-stranded DNA-binding protein